MTEYHGLGEMMRGAAALAKALALPELRAVERMDRPRYAGRAYEIASFPQSFQRGCAATTATCTLRGDGKVGVLNECRALRKAGPGSRTSRPTPGNL